MANGGLEKVMSCAFAGVPKMLIGKKVSHEHQGSQICSSGAITCWRDG